MQSSMWKLLTAAGIIGIGTMVVLEVQNRLPMPTHASKSADAAPAYQGTETDVVPDASVDLDRFLADQETGGQPQFALSEPAETKDQAPEPFADAESFVGVPEVNRTVLRANLADEDNPFDRAFEADSSPKSVKSVPVTEAETNPGTSEASGTSTASETSAASPVTPASFVDDSAKEPATHKTVTPTAAQGSSPTLFFNGSGQRTSNPATASQTVAAPAAAAPTAIPTGKAAAASTQVHIDANVTKPSTVAATADKTVDRTAFTTIQQESETPELFLPDPVPNVGAQPAPRNFPADDTPLMETPEFAADPVPDFDPSPLPANPANPGNKPVTPKGSNGTDLTDDTPYFRADEPVPTPPGSSGGRPSNSDSDELPPFEPDSNLDTPRPAKPDISDSDFPQPGYPDRNAIPDLNGKSPFDGRDERDELDQPLDLPTIDNRPARTPTNGGGSAGSISPADRSMSEVMRPQLSIQKRAPDTATVGVTHEYTIVVSNDGESPAYDVVVDDELGIGAQLVNSRPTADYDRDSGKLSWSIRELAPGEKQEIVVRITPTGEGTLDGIATVRFKAQVKSATVITAPRLALEMTSPKEVKVGDEVQLRYVIRNNGTGDARNVILRSVLPPGLKHSEGGDLEYEIEVLAAGDLEEIDLTVVAAEPGRFRTVSEVTASGVSADKATTDIDIIGSQLTIQRLGPERRFVGRTAKFQNIIANETNFEASNAIVTEQVPDGMRFVAADNGGEYSPQTGRIRWEISRLAPGKQTVLEVELEAKTAGEQQTVVEVVESAGFRSQAKENTVVTVEDYENMTADISRQDDPVAIGETFGFTITIENRGTAVAKGVEMIIEVPLEIDIKAAGTRDVPARRQGNIVRYAVVDEIQPSDKMTFELKLQGQHAARNAVVRASLTYEQMKEPLIVSESVTVFDDRP